MATQYIKPVVLVLTNMGEETIGIVHQVTDDTVLVERSPYYAQPFVWYPVRRVLAILGEF